jgi:hypothetical protein
MVNPKFKSNSVSGTRKRNILKKKIEAKKKVNGNFSDKLFIKLFMCKQERA